MAHDGLADRGFLADEALEGVLPERRDKFDGLLLVVLLNIDDDLVEKPDLVRPRIRINHLRGLDHALQVPDAAVVAALFLLGRLIFKVFAQIAELARRLHILKNFRPQLQLAIFDLVLHFLNVYSSQFIIHDHPS